LAENLKVHFPSVNLIIVIKHPDEWEAYSTELRNLFGFTHGFHPFIYLSNGVLIGGADEFTSYVDSKFNHFTYTPQEQIVYKLTQENIKKSNEEYFNRKNGKTLRQRLDEKLNEAEFFEKSCTIDIPYKFSYDKGMLFYYKISEKFLPDLNEWKNFVISDYIKDDILEIVEKLPTQKSEQVKTENNLTGGNVITDPENKDDGSGEVVNNHLDTEEREKAENDIKAVKEVNDLNNNKNEVTEKVEEKNVERLSDKNVNTNPNINTNPNVNSNPSNNMNTNNNIHTNNNVVVGSMENLDDSQEIKKIEPKSKHNKLTNNFLKILVTTYNYKRYLKIEPKLLTVSNRKMYFVEKNVIYY